MRYAGMEAGNRTEWSSMPGNVITQNGDSMSRKPKCHCSSVASRRRVNAFVRRTVWRCTSSARNMNGR